MVAYEEKDPSTLAAFKAGYPRFFRNPLLVRLSRLLERENLAAETDPLLSEWSTAVALCEHLQLSNKHICDHRSFFSVSLPKNPEILEKCRYFLQHTGMGLSSREAESVLHMRYGEELFQERRRPNYANANLAFIQNELHQVYGTASPKDIHLFRSGMNAFYAGFAAINHIQLNRGRDIWVQLGWLYVDTVRILEKLNPSGCAPIGLINVFDLDGLKEVLRDKGHRVAGIVTEVPTNPLVETPDVEALYKLSRKYRTALVIDPTLASPHNVHVLPFADIHINSLTKYAAATGDVMMGAIALNESSPFYDDLLPIVGKYGCLPSEGDLARMAQEIEHYGATIEAINARTPVVAEFLERHPKVASVHWAYKQPGEYNFRWLQHHQNGPGGIISFVPKGDLAPFYDNCNFAKSPSFGTRFTMLCPFMYLAHYDLIHSDAGQMTLSEAGLHPNLMRLSIGIEPAEAIIEELDRCL